MKNILLPTDFSATSMNAMDYAVQLFKNEDCTFHVLNTYEPVAFYTAAAYGTDATLEHDIEEIFKKKSQDQVQKVIDTLKANYPDQKHRYKGVSSFNILSLEIEELVETFKMNAIVMGTKGASGLKEVFIGSQTMHTIKNAKIPVVGIPQDYSYKQPKDILFTTDYKTGTDQQGLELLESICFKNISRLIFLNVYQGENLTEQQVKNMEALDQYFKRDAHLTQIAKGMEILDAMEDFQSRHAIDLLVLVHNKRNFFENLLFKPIIQKTVHRSNVPFLILPPGN